MSKESLFRENVEKRIQQTDDGTLVVSDINSSGIDQKSFVSIILEELKSRKDITTLYAGEGQIGNTGAETLIEALPGTRLTNLHLERCIFTKDDIELSVRALLPVEIGIGAWNNVITTIPTNPDKIQEMENASLLRKKIQEQIQQTSDGTLVVSDIDSKSVGQKTFTSIILQELRGRKDITTLYAQEAQIGTAGADALIEALPRTYLTNLHLEKNQVNKNDVTYSVEALLPVAGAWSAQTTTLPFRLSALPTSQFPDLNKISDTQKKQLITALRENEQRTPPPPLVAGNKVTVGFRRAGFEPITIEITEEMAAARRNTTETKAEAQANPTTPILQLESAQQQSSDPLSAISHPLEVRLIAALRENKQKNPPSPLVAGNTVTVGIRGNGIPPITYQITEEIVKELGNTPAASPLEILQGTSSTSYAGQVQQRSVPVVDKATGSCR